MPRDRFQPRPRGVLTGRSRAGDRIWLGQFIVVCNGGEYCTGRCAQCYYGRDLSSRLARISHRSRNWWKRKFGINGLNTSSRHVPCLPWHDSRILWPTVQTPIGWHHPMLLTRRIISAVLSIVPLLLIGAGVVTMLRGIQARNPSIYSVQGEQYFTYALVFSSAGLIGLFGCRRLWDANTSWKWALAPIATFILAVVFPKSNRAIMDPQCKERLPARRDN